MSGKRKPTPGMVYVICEKSAHHGTQEWARYGHHRVEALRLHFDANRGPILTRAGTIAPGVRPMTVQRYDGASIAQVSEDDRALPLKKWVPETVGDDRDEHTSGTWLFTCCDQNKQVSNTRMFEIIVRYSSAFPQDTRVLIPMNRL